MRRNFEKTVREHGECPPFATYADVNLHRYILPSEAASNTPLQTQGDLVGKDSPLVQACVGTSHSYKKPLDTACMVAIEGHPGKDIPAFVFA